MLKDYFPTAQTSLLQTIKQCKCFVSIYLFQMPFRTKPYLMNTEPLM